MTAVTSSVKDLSSNIRQKLVANVQNSSLRFGRAIKIDGAHLRMHGKHYFNFTFHFIKMNEKGPFSNVQFMLKNVALALVEGPDYPNVQSIKSCLNEALINKYSNRFDFFTRGFRIFADEAAVSANVAGTSVSREVHVPHETWISGMIHFLNTKTKNVITNHCHTEIFQVVLLDFRSMKEINEDAKRAGWNHLLPEKYWLLLESETRFRTHCQVAERFLKAAPEINSLLDSHLGASAGASYSGLKKIFNINGTITGYTAIEAVFDAFGIVVDYIEHFEVSQRPTIYISLPFIFQMMQKLEDVTNGIRVWREKDKRWHILQFFRGL